MEANINKPVLFARFLGREVRLDWDEAKDCYVGSGVWSGVDGWATLVPLTEENFARATISEDEEVS